MENGRWRERKSTLLMTVAVLFLSHSPSPSLSFSSYVVLRATSLEMEREGKEAGWLAGMGRGPDGRTTT